MQAIIDRNLNQDDGIIRGKAHYSSKYFNIKGRSVKIETNNVLGKTTIEIAGIVFTPTELRVLVSGRGASANGKHYVDREILKRAWDRVKDYVPKGH